MASLTFDECRYNQGYEQQHQEQVTVCCGVFSCAFAPDFVHSTIRLLRETSTLRRAMMERRNRLEEWIAALMAQWMDAHK